MTRTQRRCEKDETVESGYCGTHFDAAMSVRQHIQSVRERLVPSNHLSCFGAGVYAILGGDNRVYVGQSRAVLGRQCVRIAMALALPWGVVRALPQNVSPSELRREEVAVGALFTKRGFTVFGPRGFSQLSAIKVYAVEIEMSDAGQWIAWSTEHVVADNLTAAIAKAERAYSRYGAGAVRASAAKFVLAAR